MSRLDSFQGNNTRYLYHLSVKLNKVGFFQTYITNSQYQLFNHILEAVQSSGTNFELWEHFINANLSLKIEDDVNEPETGAERETVEYPFAEGTSTPSKIALRIRHLLWEKAVDCYYQEEAQSDDDDCYAILDTVEEIDVQDAVNGTAEPKVRDEEDDYDDDEEEPNDIIIADTAPEYEYNYSQQLVFADEEKKEKPKEGVSGQEELVKKFRNIYHLFDTDKENLAKRRKLEEYDKQLETYDKQSGPQTNGHSHTAPKASINMNLGAANLSLKHLLSSIENNRDKLSLSDAELRSLIFDVRKNRSKWASDDKIGQEELYEAAEKVVMELRGYTEHSTAFLNKVSKREAPNYFQVIKKPMDLNTVLKKLKTFQYKSKAEFVDDVMLIWRNCLTYNSDPTHFLRIHALAMQKKALVLTPLIPDIVIRDRAEVEAEEQNDDHSTPVTTRVLGGQKGHTTKGRKRTSEEEKPIIVAASESATPLPIPGTPVSLSVVAETPAQLEDEEENDLQEEEQGSSLDQKGEDDLELQTWKNITSKARAEYCSQRAELFKDNRIQMDSTALLRYPDQMKCFNEYLHGHEVVSKSHSLLENEEPYLIEYDVTAGIPSFKYLGVSESQAVLLESRLVDQALDAEDTRSDFLPPPGGLNEKVNANITEMQEIKKVCFRISLIRQMQSQQFVHHTQLRPPKTEAIEDSDIDRISKLPNHDRFSHPVQYLALKRSCAKIAMQNGFETTEPFAMDTLTQIAEDYMGNLARTLKMHCETPSIAALGNSEVLLMALMESGIEKPDNLYTYVREKIFKQQTQLKELKEKLSLFLKELLRPGIQDLSETNFQDNSDQFLTGDFTAELGEDFFGFKELGLTAEYNMSGLSLPLHLLHARIHNSYLSQDGSNVKKKYDDLVDLSYPEVMASQVSEQIGLLGPFFEGAAARSKQFMVKQQKKTGEGEALVDGQDYKIMEDEDLPQKQRNSRPRLPPTGKIAGIKKRPVANSFFLVG
ncbi:hypothetical protein BABINDRAFT_159768 [Babjeviella inositovora NRRL Y-12698]|uniref:SAGA complex subunit Spt7 n=1 Tax=Babjeviella inositovora NRRL Y-12698 TaxID=984486 RepID=A0A1E3QUY3_9ASCO|nr:uncharacterized protein BABINDRAFT_159768 [Babjeviella inositovora NRRL Y-12698]ODQ81489.1 hypothetical protein BABINDRAFT_159768 [Babjeviella inositovora NRRL Y-12698]